MGFPGRGPVRAHPRSGRQPDRALGARLTRDVDVTHLTVNKTVGAPLRAALDAVVEGSNRRQAADHLLALLRPDLALPWIDELTYATKQYLLGSEDVDGTDLADLARLALADWPTKRWSR